MTPAFNVSEIPSPSVQFDAEDAIMLDSTPRVACTTQRVRITNSYSTLVRSTTSWHEVSVWLERGIRRKDLYTAGVTHGVSWCPKRSD